MPAVTKFQLQVAMEEALSKKFKKRDAEGNEIDGQIPDAMQDMVEGMAEGIAKAWSDWQAVQLVNGGVCVPSGPITGGQLLP